MSRRHFSPKVFQFLRELEANNEKPWWEANKDRYVEVIREPALEFIDDFGPHIREISSHFLPDARTVGGSLMRPYRDLRFSKDKTPYKTNVGIQFRHERGKDVHAPGFYLHLEPRGCFAGVGLWRPETKVARRIRRRINDDPAGWEKAAKDPGFSEVWSMEGTGVERLKRVPKEFDEGHPHADDLRLKSFIADSSLTQAQVTNSSFVTELASMYSRAGPFMRFLCEAVDLEF